MGIRLWAFRKLVESELTQLSDQDLESRQELQDIHHTHAFWKEKPPLLFERWQKQCKAGPSYPSP